jgi:hypothetical protein
MKYIISFCLIIFLNIQSVCSQEEQKQIKGFDLLSYFSHEQKMDGSFMKPILTSSVLYNTHMLFLYHYLGLQEEKKDIVEKLFNYIWKKQSESGGFNSYEGAVDGADISQMVNLVAELYSVNNGEFLKLKNQLKKNKRLQRAKHLALPYIMLSGKIDLVKRIKWIGFNTLSKREDGLPWIKVLLFPFHFLMQTKGWVGANFSKNSEQQLSKSEKTLKSLFEKYVDNQGLVFSYAPTTIPWIMSWHHVYKNSSNQEMKDYAQKIIHEGLKTIESFQVQISENMLYQSPGEGSVAETAEIANMLLDAKVNPNHPVIEKATNYFLSIQNSSGGYGFSKYNNNFTDADDTSVVLEYLLRIYKITNSPHLIEPINNAADFILTQTNRDGGFDPWNMEREVIWWFKPIERRIRKTGIVVSESVIDATARVVYALGEIKDQNPKIHAVWKRGINWLIKKQNKNGSYLSTWMVGYGFGTGSVLMALNSAIGDKSIKQKALINAIDKAIQYLKTIQRNDGSFTEHPTLYEGKTISQESYASSVAMTGLVLSRMLLFVKDNSHYQDQLKEIAQKAYSFLYRNIPENQMFSDDTWTAVSFPKIEYAKYHYIQYSGVYRSILIYENIYQSKM